MTQTETIITSIATVLIVAGLILGGVQCNRQTQETYHVCLEKHPPTECRAAIGGAAWWTRPRPKPVRRARKP